ncbi:MAG: hypothetical protein ACO1NU_08675 [Arcticibacter sp.]
MEFISKQDFTSHIYEESMGVISRDDDQKVQEALQIGMQTAARYLGRYNTALIFTSSGDDKLKYAELITYIKDIAKWHFIAVCNVTVDLELAERRYKSALTELGKIQAGSFLSGWPVLNESTVRPFRSGSQKKFNHY